MNPEGSNCRRFQVTQEGRYNVSCNWARNNVERWTAWVPVRTNCYAGFLVWIKFCFLVGSLCLNAATSSIYIGELSYKKQGPDPFGEGLVRVQGPPAFCRVKTLQKWLGPMILGLICFWAPGPPGSRQSEALGWPMMKECM